MKAVDEECYGIRVVDEDGIAGFATDDNGIPILERTRQEAEARVLAISAEYQGESFFVVGVRIQEQEGMFISTPSASGEGKGGKDV